MGWVSIGIVAMVLILCGLGGMLITEAINGKNEN